MDKRNVNSVSCVMRLEVRWGIMTRWKTKCGTTAVLLVPVMLRQSEDDLAIDSESCLDTLYELLQSRFRAT
jgi:hypothetical protein